jgi:hypothetical protein
MRISNHAQNTVECGDCVAAVSSAKSERLQPRRAKKSSSRVEFRGERRRFVAAQSLTISFEFLRQSKYPYVEIR